MLRIFHKIISILLLTCFLGSQVLSASTLAALCKCAESEHGHEHCESMDEPAQEQALTGKIFLCNCYKEHRKLMNTLLTHNFGTTLAVDAVSPNFDEKSHETPYIAHGLELDLVPDPPYPKALV